MTEDNIVEMLIVFATAGAIQYALVRKHIASLADPLAYFVLTSSFSLALGTFVSDDPWLVVRIYFYFACFYAGLHIAAGKVRAPGGNLTLTQNLRQFRAIVLGCAITYVILNAILWSQSGVILLADNPSLEKSEAYAGGFGFVRRFNWSVGAFALVATTYWVLWERRALPVAALVIVVLTTLTSGSKAALLPAILAVGLYVAHPFASRKGPGHSERLRRMIPVLLAVAVIPVMLVLTAENDSLNGAVDAFVIRLFYFGDVLLYWGQDAVRGRFAGLGLLAYLENTLGAVLGALRLIAYDTPIGNQFVQYTLPAGTDFSDSLGPNLPFYVRGELYLGIWVAPLHAFIIGWAFGRLRRVFLNYRGHSLLAYALRAFIVVVSVTLPTEEGLAVGQLFDFVLFFAPIFAAASYFSGPVRRPKQDATLPSSAS